MVVTQSAVTLIAEILAGHERAVQTLLEAAGQDAAHNDLVSFSVFPSVHFARFFVIDASQDLQGRPLAPRLVFLADVDGSADEFLSELTQRAAGGLAALYEHCRDFPGKAALRTFLQSCSVPTAALYVNTRGRTVAQVHQEAALREAIQGYLDRAQDEWRDASPRRVRAAIQEFVEREAALAWARRPLQGPDISYVLGGNAEPVHLGRPAQTGSIQTLYGDGRPVGHELSGAACVQSR